MAEQDNIDELGVIELAVSVALMQARTITVGKVIAYREIGPHKSPVVDVQIGPLKFARPVDGQASATAPVPVKRNVPVASMQSGNFTMRAQLSPGQHVLIAVADRDLNTWMQGDGEPYRPGIPGVVHNINDAIAIPVLMPEQFQSKVRPGPTELYIGDNTGEVCSVQMNSATGNVTVKAATTVSVEAPAVSIGDGLFSAPIARTGVDFVVVPPGGAGGSFPILPGTNPALPIPVPGPPSAHTVKG